MEFCKHFKIVPVQYRVFGNVQIEHDRSGATIVLESKQMPNFMDGSCVALPCTEIGAIVDLDHPIRSKSVSDDHGLKHRSWPIYYLDSTGPCIIHVPRHIKNCGPK